VRYNIPLDIPFTPTKFQKLWPKEIVINSFLVHNLIFVCCLLGHIVTIATHNLLLPSDSAWSIKITQALLLPKKSPLHINSKYFASLWRPYFSLLFLYNLRVQLTPNMNFGMGNIWVILRRNVMYLYSKKPHLGQLFHCQSSRYDVIRWIFGKKTKEFT
jgi:hypothetical protein